MHLVCQLALLLYTRHSTLQAREEISMYALYRNMKCWVSSVFPPFMCTTRKIKYFQGAEDKLSGRWSLSLPFSAPFVSSSVTYGLVPPLVEAIHHCVSVSMHAHPVGNFLKGWKGFGLTATWFNFLCFFETLLKWSVHYWAQYVAATIPSKEVLLWLGSCSWCFELIQGEHACVRGEY